MEDRPALGIGLGNSGSKRDTLGVLVISVGDSTPAARAGLEEGNRIAAINGVNLRVASEDAGDRYVGQAKAQRLRREIAQLKPGNDVTLRVYANGQFRDVRAKVARVGDLPKSGNRMFFFDGEGPMPPMPAMPPMPPMGPGVRIMRAPRAPMAPMTHLEFEDSPTSFHLELGPAIEAALHEAGVQIERVRPQVNRVLRDLPRTLERIQIPTVDLDVRVNETNAPAPAKAVPAVQRTSVQI
jgi:hypothetical protein